MASGAALSRGRTVAMVACGGVLAAVVMAVGGMLVACSRYEIPTRAMSPTIQPGDGVWARPVRGADVDRGDIVVFRPPQGSPLPAVPRVMRVVALGGDTVDARGGRVRVDGVPLDERYLDDGSPTLDFPETSVPVGAVFVLGDNRGNAADSRVFGAVPPENVDERVVRIGVPSTALLLLPVALAAAVLLFVVFWPRIRLVRADLIGGERA